MIFFISSKISTLQQKIFGLCSSDYKEKQFRIYLFAHTTILLGLRNYDLQLTVRNPKLKIQINAVYLEVG